MNTSCDLKVSIKRRNEVWYLEVNCLNFWHWLYFLFYLVFIKLSWHWMEVYYKSFTVFFFFSFYIFPLLKLYFNRLLLGIIYCGIHWGNVHLQQWLMCRIPLQPSKYENVRKNLRERYLWLVYWSYPSQIV